MFKKKNSKYHSILQSSKKTHSKSNLATRHEEITNELESNKNKADDISHEITTLEENLHNTHNVAEKNTINIKISELKSQVDRKSVV